MSEIYKGDYAPELYSEDKRYYLLQSQELANLTDAELRDMHLMSNTLIRRVINDQIGTCAIDNGFLITEKASDKSNNFNITGGDGTKPGLFYLDGYRLYLNGTIAYKDQTSNLPLTADAYTRSSIHSLSTPTGPVGNLVAVAGNGTFLTADSSNIYRTTNVGTSWVASASPATGIQSISMGDSSVGYAVSGSNLRKNIDVGGTGTWASITVSDAVNLNAVEAVDIGNVWMVDDAGRTYFTQDGGSSFSDRPVAGDILTFTDNLKCLSVLDMTGVWAAGTNGSVVYYDNGVWDNRLTGVNITLNGIHAFNSTSAVVCGDSTVVNGDSTSILITSDGIDWTSISADTSSDLKGLYFKNSSIGWAVGTSGVITRTLDGGLTWDATTLNASYDFNAITFDGSTGFITGSNGIIYRSLDDGSNWERYRTDYVYLDFHLGEVSADSSSGSEYIDTDTTDASVGFPRANRLRIVRDIKVSEGWPTPPDYQVTGVDGTVQHYTQTLAKIQRYPGKYNIDQTDIIDARRVVKTIAELDSALKNGGVDTSSLADGSITPSKIASDQTFFMGGLNTTGDATIGGNIFIEGSIVAPDSTTQFGDLSVTNLTVGDSTSPYDSTVNIFGHIIVKNDQSVASFDVHSYASTSSFPVVNIVSDGSGAVFNVQKTSGSTSSVFDINTAGNGNDFTINHAGTSGDVFNIIDDSTGNTFNILKDSVAGSVLSVDTSSNSTAIDITNTTSSGTTLKIDQLHGTMAWLHTGYDATGIFLDSSGPSTDLKIVHTGINGTAVDITSAGAGGTLSIRNTRGPAVTVTQKADAILMSLNKDSTGSGDGLEVNYRGSDVGVQVNNSGSGIAGHFSHTGDSTNPAVSIYVAGSERGPAFYINKANQDSTLDIGQAAYIWNQGYSQTESVQ